ncbi:MAG: hypothetical protein QM723_22800 [Myxococcaceae bacterium]
MRSLALVAVLLAAPAFAQAAADDGAQAAQENGSDGYTPTEDSVVDALRVSGYVDVGYAKAAGDGTSWPAGETRSPGDYAVDPFATAVNSRGDVAALDPNRFTNGFLPRAMNIGGNPSFLLNTLSAELRFAPRTVPVFVFARVQLMPRFFGPTGDQTRVELQQAFGRFNPFSSQEFTVSVGKFDSVFGIEYLETEANLRLGITPSLVARYTTGQSLGLKAFYRLELPKLWSGLSLNAAVTNNGTRVESLVPVDASLTGGPVFSGRLGYELNLRAFQLKLGFSALYGPRNDQLSRGAHQRAFGGDARIEFKGLHLAGELLTLHDDESPIEGKLTGQGPAELASEFEVTGGWVRLGYTLPFKADLLTAVTPYVRWDRRHGQFEGFTPLDTDRFSFGLQLQLYESVLIKAEYLWNRELHGAPQVDNDVFTSSLVLTW